MHLPQSLASWFEASRRRTRSLIARLPSRSAAVEMVHKPVKVLFVVLFAFAGAWLGLYLSASSNQPVGPVETTMRLAPSLNGSTSVLVPPLGTLTLDSHAGPLRFDITVNEINQEKAQAIFSNPEVLNTLQDDVTSDLRAGVTGTLARGLAGGTVGAAIAALIATRRVRTTLVTAGVAAATLGASYGVAGITWDNSAIAEPKYEGLLAGAPSLIGHAEDIADNFDAYSLQLARLVTNVTQLYDLTSTLPTYQASEDVIRLLHVSDIELAEHAWPVIRSVVDQYDVDVIVDSGDTTDHGSAAENRFLNVIATLDVPYVWVRGNHDSVITQQAMQRLPNVTVLDGGVETVAGLRFLGAGDPRFTPDRSYRDEEAETIAVAQQARALAEVAKEETLPIDVIVYHDTAGAAFFDGHASLVLTGHGHRRLDLVMPRGTRLMQQGSTGGGGLRALQSNDGEPSPIELSVLYVGEHTGLLEAWDEITLGGIGLTSVELERRQVRPGEETTEPTPIPTPTDPPPPSPLPEPTFTPSPSPTDEDSPDDDSALRNTPGREPEPDTDADVDADEATPPEREDTG